MTVDLAARYVRAEALLPANALAHVYAWVVRPVWFGTEGEFWYRVRRRDGFQFIRVTPATRDARPAFDHAALAERLSDRLGRRVAPGALPFQVIELTQEGVLFEVDGERLRFASETGLAPARPAPARDLLSAPCGQRAVTLRDHNLHLVDLATGESRPLTRDGMAHCAWGAEPGGTMDALSATPATPAAAWSPCGRWLLVFRCDERAVAEMPVPDLCPDDLVRPSVRNLRLPLIGEGTADTASFWIIDTTTCSAVRADIPAFPAMESPFWFARQGLPGPEFWTPDGHLYLTRRAPGGREQSLTRVDPATGATRCLITERSETPVFLNAFEFARPNWRILRATGEIIWYAERNGWGQLYLHEPEGPVRHRIGGGDHVVRDILALDEAARLVWCTAHGLCPSGNPYNRHLLRASLDGGPPEVLTTEPVDHVIWPSPCGRWFVDLMGAPDRPSRSVLRDRDGTGIMALEDTDATDLFARGYRPPEVVAVPAADGHTRLQAALFLPSDFDPARRYPVLDAIYGWSQVTVVPHGFLLDTGGPLDGGLEIAAENALLPAATAELGFVVVVIDGRGTPFRDRAFHAPAFTDPTLSTGLADHASALRTLAASRPWMDLTRTGIFGHSGGGHMAAKAMMLHPDLFRAAVASAGCHDVRLYHAAWADLWGLTPEALAASAVPPLAHRLQGALLLAHGDCDENVHIAHTLRLAQALIAADRDFDLLILPGRHHDFTLDPHFLRRRWDFLVRHVMGSDPPRGLHLNPGTWSDIA